MVSTYQEAHDAFVKWHPKTLKREGANGMQFDYLPVQDYENYLDETIGAGNWESQALINSAGVAVTLSIFGVRKSSTSSIHKAGKIKSKKSGEYIENPQPNEVEKAEARAFRRAAAKHGLLRHLWEKETSSGSDAGEESEDRPRTQSKASGSGSGGASAAQLELLKKFEVPARLAKSSKLTGGREGTASGIIGLLIAARKTDPEAYDEDPMKHIRRAVKKIDSSLLSLLEEEEDAENDED